MTITRLAAALCGITLGALGVAVPAQAGEWTGTDPARDVAAKTCRPTCDYTAAPGRASADMVRLRVVHGRDAVRVAVRLRDADPSRYFGVTNILATTERKGRYFAAIASFGPGRQPSVAVTNPSGIRLRCAGATAELRGDTVRTTVPTRCLNRPEYVRWSGYVREVFPGDLDQDRRYAGWFDKFRTSSSTPLNKNTYEFSRKIFRGR